MDDRRQEILDAALAIADERGLDAVSMRSVAQRVGLTSMALYPHVGDKGGLLDGLVGRLLGELPAPDPDADWRDRLQATAHAVRALARRHPAAIGLLFARPSVTPDAVRVVDDVYRALLTAGVPPAAVPRLERLVSTVILGYAISEAAGRFTPADPRAARGTDLPGHHALATHLAGPVDWTAEFNADLDDLVGLIERAAGR